MSKIKSFMLKILSKSKLSKEEAKEYFKGLYEILDVDCMSTDEQLAIWTMILYLKRISP